jgi:hypothetical protein
MRQSQRTRRGRKQQTGAEREAEEVVVDREDVVDLGADVVEVAEEAFSLLQRGGALMTWDQRLLLFATQPSGSRGLDNWLLAEHICKICGFTGVLWTQKQRKSSLAQMKFLYYSLSLSHCVRHILST